MSSDQGNNDSRGFLSAEEVSTQAQGSVYGFRSKTILDPTVISKEVQAQLKSSSLGSSGSGFSDNMVDIQKSEDEDKDVLLESFTVKSNKKYAEWFYYLRYFWRYLHLRLNTYVVKN